MYQFLVAGSSLLAGLTIGCSVGYPGVLMQQLGSNDSSIHLDLDTVSWIGSIHGLTGIPTIITPAFMQWKGRKLAFIVSCLFSIIGWVLASTATSSSTILISESFIGFGTHSVASVAMLSMSEMISPQYRNVTGVCFFNIQALSLAVVEILGKYLHWRTVSMVMSMPIIVATLIACIWPESPSWLAYRGEFDKCEKAFTRLRGTSDLAKTELEELIMAQKEYLVHDKWNKQPPLKYLWFKMKSRDFYLPSLHILVLLTMADWSGILVIIVYASEIIKKTTQSEDAVFYGTIILNCTLFICFTLHIFLVRYFSPKKVFLTSALGTIVCLLGASIVNYSQTAGLISEDTPICLYLLIGYMICITLGVLPIVYTKANELMPVKHRDVGGPLSMVFVCILDSTSLKLGPYLFLHIKLWGTLLLYAVNAILCGLFILKYVPETKGRTLQQLEDYYAYGCFDEVRQQHTHTSLFQ